MQARGSHTRSSSKKRAHFQDDPSGSDLSLRRTSTAPAEYSHGADEHDELEAERWEPGRHDERDEDLGRFVVEVQANLDMIRFAGDEDDADIDEAEARAGDAAVWCGDSTPDECSGSPTAGDSEARTGHDDDSDQAITPDEYRDDPTADDDDNAEAEGNASDEPEPALSPAVRDESSMDSSASDIDDGLDERRPHTPDQAQVPTTIRRLSDPHARRTPQSTGVRRRAFSMPDVQDIKGRLKPRPFAAKATPAPPAITACSVRAAELAAWSWARGQEVDDGEGGLRPGPLMRIDADTRRDRSEDPPAPPNTERHSASSSARHSSLHTPHELEMTVEEGEDQAQADDEADEEDDQPVELRFKSAFHRIRSLSMPASTDYLTMPGHNSYASPPAPVGGRAPSPIPRPLSNLAAEDERFQSHRDSLDLNHRRMNEERMNHLLSNTRDSFVLAKSRYDGKYPKAGAGMGMGIQYSRSGGLSPIPDASPPDGRRVGMEKGMVEIGKKAVEMRADDEGVKCEGHLSGAGRKGDGVKWYKAKYMRGEGEVLSLRLLEEEVSE